MPMTISLSIMAVIILFLGAPMAVALGLSTISVMLIFHPVPNMQLVPQLFSEASTGFIMVAVPLFILAGCLMEKGTVGKNLIDFVCSIVGWARGGLGATAIVGSMIFGGISGSSLADTATFGTILPPRMAKSGYPKDYAATVVLMAACLDVVIPPSILLVLASAATQQSVAKALAGGLIPGILMGLLLLIPNYLISRKQNYGERIPFSISNIIKQFRTCWTALIAPIIILGTIFSGLVTPTEGAAVAVLYVLFIDGIVYKKLKIPDIVDSLKTTAVITSAILFIVTSGALMNFIISFENVPRQLAELLVNMPGGKYGFLILMDIILIVIGMTVDASPATIIFTPLFLPIAVTMGVDPIHFIVLTVVGLALGLTTPPYGVCLFSISSICKVPLSRLIKQGLPFYAVLFIGLILITFIPEISLFFPRILGI